jgi:hypothetical protein
MELSYFQFANSRDGTTTQLFSDPNNATYLSQVSESISCDVIPLLPVIARFRKLCMKFRQMLPDREFILSTVFLLEITR